MSTDDRRTTAERMLAALGLDADELEPLGARGSAWRRRGAGGLLLLRLYPEERPRRRLEAELAALRFLEAERFPAPRLHASPQAPAIAEIEGGRGYLTHFLVGAPASLDEETVRRLGALVGRLHALPAATAGLPRTDFSVRRVREGFEAHAAAPAIRALPGWDEVGAPAAAAFERLGDMGRPFDPIFNSVQWRCGCR